MPSGIYVGISIAIGIVIIILLALFFLIIYKTRRNQITKYKKEIKFRFWKVKFNVKKHNFYLKQISIVIIALAVIEILIFLT